MPKQMDKRLSDILAKYDEDAREAAWDCHGTWVVYHKAIERIAAKAGITFDMPEVVQASAADRIAVIIARGFMGDRSEWSFGEAAPSNNKNSYPFAMAEKRAKDRVVLKLVGLHGLAYSEEESEAFNPQAPPPTDETYSPPPRKANGLPEKGWRSDGSRTSFWLKKNGTWDELKAELHQDAEDCLTLLALGKLKDFYRDKARELKFNKEFQAGLAEEFSAIERRILEAMDAVELSTVDTKTALKHSVERNAYADAFKAG